MIVALPGRFSNFFVQDLMEAGTIALSNSLILPTDTQIMYYLQIIPSRKHAYIILTP